MLFTKAKEKELRMIWEVQKNDKRSFLVGTAHYFPYSFKTSLSRYIENARAVLFEGPLDKDNMNKVVDAGVSQENVPHLFEDLDRQTIARISKVLSSPRSDRGSLFFELMTPSTEKWLYDMLKGMKPWMAFFTLWTSFLEKRGWRYSVDLQAYHLAGEMGKEIVFLETIEEQIDVLENLSHERIIDFLNRIEHWDGYSEDYVTCYLNGDLENLTSMGIRHPTRSSFAIGRRDRILYERMLGYLEQGDTVACVGAPHITGIRGMLRANGYQTQRASNV